MGGPRGRVDAAAQASAQPSRRAAARRRRGCRARRPRPARGSKARIASREQDHAGDDRRRAVGVQADDLAALGFGHVGQPREQQLDGGQQQRVAVHALGVVGVELLVDRGRRGGGAGDGDRRAAPARARPAGRPARKIARVSSASACSSSGAGGSVWMWRSLMRTTPACSETWKPARAAGADDELGRAAADVDHDRRLDGARRAPDIAPRNVSCASSSPLRTRASRPNSLAHALGEVARRWRRRARPRSAPRGSASQPCSSISAR